MYIKTFLVTEDNINANMLKSECINNTVKKHEHNTFQYLLRICNEWNATK